jgi:hypothetical protein
MQSTKILKKPKTGIIATIFPSESTWHSLYNHPFSEITSNIMATGKDNEIATIVKKSFIVKARARFIISAIITSILVLILAYTSWTKSNTPPEEKRKIGLERLFSNGPNMYFWGAALMAIITIGSGAHLAFFAKNKGESFWDAYVDDAPVGQRNKAKYDAQLEREDKNKRAAARSAAIRSSGSRYGNRNSSGWTFRL